MRIAEVRDPRKVERAPDGVVTVLDSGRMTHDEFVIRKVELRLYVDGGASGGPRGPYSLVTSFVETDKGSVEITYDEGFLGERPLESAGRLLSEHLGLSALVLRSVISLRARIAGRDAPADDAGGRK